MQLRGNKLKLNTSRIAFLGVILGVSIILSYIEYLIPFNFGIPGIKLGLANLCVVLLIYLFGFKEAVIVNTLRVLLVGMMFGSGVSIIYSLTGATASILIMFLCYKLNIFSIGGVSLAGGVMHNVGQCLVASLVVNDIKVFVYLPALLIAGAITGLLIGYITGLIIPRLRRLI